MILLLFICIWADVLMTFGAFGVLWLVSQTEPSTNYTPRHMPVLWNKITRVHKQKRLHCFLHKQADIFLTSSIITMDHTRNILFGSFNPTVKEAFFGSILLTISSEIDKCRHKDLFSIFKNQIKCEWLWAGYVHSNNFSVIFTVHTVYTHSTHTYLYAYVFVLDSYFRWWSLIYKITTCNPILFPPMEGWKKRETFFGLCAWYSYPRITLLWRRRMETLFFSNFCHRRYCHCPICRLFPNRIFVAFLEIAPLE